MDTTDGIYEGKGFSRVNTISFMRDRKNLIGEFNIGKAAASGTVNCFPGYEWVDIKERKGIED